MIFRIPLFAALIAAGVAAFFFLWQLAEGPYEGFGPFFFGMALIWGLIASAVVLKRRGQAVLGALVLLPVVFPATMYGVFILLSSPAARPGAEAHSQLTCFAARATEAPCSSPSSTNCAPRASPPR